MKNIAIIFGAVFVTFGMVNSVILCSDARLDKKVVAVINGEEISRYTLANVLINIHGREGLEQIIRRTLKTGSKKK